MQRRILHLVLLGCLAAAPLFASDRILLVASRYVERKPVQGLRFSCRGVASRPTGQTGATELDLPAGSPAGRQLKIDLVATKKAQDEACPGDQGVDRWPERCLHSRSSHRPRHEGDPSLATVELSLGDLLLSEHRLAEAEP